MTKLTIGPDTPTLGLPIAAMEMWPKATPGQQFAVTTVYKEGLIMHLLRKLGVIDGPLEVTKCYQINQNSNPVEIPCPKPYSASSIQIPESGSEPSSKKP